MLAIGDRSKSTRSLYHNIEFANMYRRDGWSEQRIAAELGLSIFELKNLHKSTDASSDIPQVLGICQRCGKAIPINTTRRSYGGLDWHLDPDCDKK